MTNEFTFKYIYFFLKQKGLVYDIGFNYPNKTVVFSHKTNKNKGQLAVARR